MVPFAQNCDLDVILNEHCEIFDDNRNIFKKIKAAFKNSNKLVISKNDFPLREQHNDDE